MEKIAGMPKRERLGFLNEMDDMKQQRLETPDFPAPKDKNSNDFPYK